MLVRADARPAQLQCLNCGRYQTWADTRVQLGRMIRKGFTPDEAKRRSPICGKCVTRLAKFPSGEGGGSTPFDKVADPKT